MKEKIFTEEAPINDSVHLRGFFRIKLGKPDENGVVKVVNGDTGWFPNTITASGKDLYLSQLLGAMAGSQQVKYAALGTGTTVNSASSYLPGEITATNGRCAVTATTANASGTVNFAFTLASGISNATGNISNVGLFNYSSQGSGQIFAGNTFASSALTSNQAVNGTYQLQF
jgi:hypothetical protein